MHVYKATKAPRRGSQEMGGRGALVPWGSESKFPPGRKSKGVGGLGRGTWDAVSLEPTGVRLEVLLGVLTARAAGGVGVESPQVSAMVDTHTQTLVLTALLTTSAALAPLACLGQLTYQPQ
jgi:hypothetical protein